MYFSEDMFGLGTRFDGTVPFFFLVNEGSE